MTDEELAELEEWAKRLWPAHSLMPWFEKLIAEVRRMRAEAETIEVLREWLAAGDINTYRERWIADQKQGHWPADRIELAKRRIAALEGK